MIYDGFSTFKLNCYKILKIAEKLQDNTTWIMRLYPIMGESAIKAGIFQDMKEYNSYSESWKNLPNIRVMIDGSY